MELVTLSRAFLPRIVIDSFHSVIWTERYYGDSEVELVVDPTSTMYNALAKGTFISLKGSDEIMMIETLEAENGKLKAKGISLTLWLNNRFIRTSNKHEDRHWAIENQVPGQILATIVREMCIGGSYLNGTIPTGIISPSRFVVPGLSLGDWVKTGTPVTVAVPYGPVYDALYEIATTYEIGMQVILVSATESGYSLKFRNYRGLDRTSNQSVNGLVRFSSDMGSLTDIKELSSIAGSKTVVWAFAPANPDNLATTPGYEFIVTLEGSTAGFDLRAQMIFAEDITTDQVGGNATTLLNMLNTRARDTLMNSRGNSLVDGEIVPDIQFKYGVHYTLGDLVEIQGVSGAIQVARVTEYIRSQDSEGEKAFPTLSMGD